MKNMKKILILSLAALLLVAVSVGGTIAFLTDKTDAITNTFTESDVDIDLTETTENYKMVPGATIDKDPTITVEAGSEPCWVFVEVTRSANFDDFMTYDMAEGWELIANNGLVDVYGFETVVDASSEDVAVQVLADNQVSVKATVTKEDMDEIADGTVDNPTLTFKAYAIQSANIEADSASDAWVVYNNNAAN